MRNPNRPDRQIERTNYIDEYAHYLFDSRNAEQIQRQQQQLLVRRLRRISRVAIVASKSDLTSRKRRLQLRIKQLRQFGSSLRSNQYRIAATSLVVLTTFSVVIPPFLQATDTKPISLDAQTSKLVGGTRDDAAKYLQYSANDRTYSFKPTKQETANYEHTGRNSDAYDSTFSQDASDGIKLTDNKTGIDVTLMPNFFTANARKSTGNHIVYKSGRAQLIYSLKYNGLKEDIVLTTPKGSTAEYAFTLRLPSGVEARLDDQGNIGIYSGDSSLYGNISYGTDADRMKVEKAREKSAKTNLVMTIPSPIVKDASGQEYANLAAFSLGSAVRKESKTAANLPEKTPAQTAASNEYPINLSAHGLANLAYPISIDPTIRVAGSSNFDGLQDEGGTQIDYTNNLIKRASMTGGIVNTWTTNTVHLPYSGSSANIDVINGYMYSTSGGATVYSAPIDISTGTVGAFTSTGIVPIAGGAEAIIHNGYMYMYGSTAWQYAKILPNGKLSSFTATTVHSQNRSNYAITASNGYIYLSGGYFQSGCPLTCTDNYLNTVQYAKQKADGSLSAWASTSSFTTGRILHIFKAYNGYLYVGGGWDDVSGGTTAFRTMQYAKQNANGTLGAWANTTVLTTGRVAPSFVFMNGYLYVIASFDAVATVEYAQVNTNGTLGTWSLTTSINGTGRGGSSAVSYNGKMYIGGGLSNSGSVFYDEIQYTSPQPPGVSTPWATTASLPSGSWAASAVASNGYIYYVGGMTTDCNLPGCTARSNVYFATINADGTTSSWATTTAFPVGIAGNRLVAAGGNIYSVGGASTCLADATIGFICSGSTSVYYSPIASNGTLGTWVTTSSFTNGRYHEGVGVYAGKYMYITGGATSNGSTTTIYSDAQYAPINSDGTLGTWVSTTALPRSFGAHGMTISGKYAYIIGSGSTPTAVYYSAINTATGALGSWTATTNISTRSYYTVAYSDKGYVYTYSTNNSAAADALRYAKINADGSLGNWTVLNSYSTARYQAAGALYNDTIYMISGSDSSANNQFTDVQYGTILHGGKGAINTWVASSKNLKTGHTRAGLIALNGYLYEISGCSSNTNPCTALNGTVEYTAINSDGSLAGWNNTTAAPIPRQGASYYTYNGRIYAQGGQSTAAGVYTRSIEFATPNGSGDITSWTSNTVNTPSDEGYGGVIAYQGYAYRVGGVNGIANGTDVSYAPIDANTGQVGSWTSLNTLRMSHQSHALVLYKNYIYVVSGNSSGGSTEFTSIKPDHTLNSWTLAAGLNIPRQEVTGFATNGSLCVVSGYNANLNRVSSGECASILQDGTLDAWKLTGNSVASDAGHTAVLYNGFIYKSGGSNSSADPTLTPEITNFNSITRKTTFDKFYDFDLGVRPSELIVRGTKQTDATVGLNYQTTNGSLTTLDNTQSVTDAGYSTNFNTLSLGTNRTLSRYLFIRFTIDDTQSATYADAGTESTITDFDMYYVANPGSRLRGGRTFTNGVDRGLDAQPQ